MINFKTERNKKNLSQQDIANMLGITQQAYANYERGVRQADYSTLQKLADIFNVTVDYLLGREAEKKKGIKIPVLGKVQAGIPIAAVEDIIDYEEITEEMASKGEYFALQVRGESMEPRFLDGDVVIVLKQTTVESGDIAIVLVNGNDATIKKIKRTDEGIMLIPLNSAFETMFYSNEQIENLPVTILGKVVELRGKF